MNIPIISDNVYELEETFQLEISVPEAAVAAGVIDGCDPYTPSATVRIADDDRKLRWHRTVLKWLPINSPLTMRLSGSC